MHQASLSYRTLKLTLYRNSINMQCALSTPAGVLRAPFSSARASARRPMCMRSTTETKESVSSSLQEGAQLKSTLDALDALLPPQPKPQQAPLPDRATQPASTSSSSPAKAPAAAWGSNSAATSSRTAKQAQQAFEKVMAFDGYAPEIINGRAAMLGFMAAISGEIISGESLFNQLLAGGAGPALLVILAVSAASFAPAIRQVPWDKVFGKDKAPASLGPFTPDAELRNGRAAMLGLLALLFIEGSSSQGFFM